ncbi:MAG: transketolase, partial [Pseudomonadota bacterium]
ANSGHSGMPMGMADVATVLFERHLKFDAGAPDWPDRDRFILSAGHGSMLLYGLLHLTGYADLPIEEIRNFRQLGAKTAGHPEFGHAAGIETTTGPLGQGLANAVGFALAERVLSARYGKGLVDHHTYCIAGDGCLMEGVSHEAIGLAGRQRLSKLIVLWDNNNISIDGEVGLADETDQIRRFRAAGWAVSEVDGHDPEAIDAAITEAKTGRRPSMIACKTEIGIGAPIAAGTAKAHGAITDDTEVAATREAYGWTHPPFEIPSEIRDAWVAIGRRGQVARAEWQARLAEVPARRRTRFERQLAGDIPSALATGVRSFKRAVAESHPKVATRKASQMALEVINKVLPETFGGSADLTGSNNTQTSDLGVHEPGNTKGRYIHYGIREHGMAAAMNGMALHGGILPYGGTFLVFTDYARAALRLSCLMGLRVVYVMTHDSIGLGEDGPTHQPVEHLASLRTIPNIRVFRPADVTETMEAWEIAVRTMNTPSVLALSRQGLPAVRTEFSSKNLVERGGYILREAEGTLQAVLLATGSEVEIALAARDALQAKGVGTRVVSMPCWELFEEQPDTYRRRVLPRGPVRVGVEAGVRFGWDRWLYGERGRREKGDFVGMETFGASAPAKDAYRHFNITSERVVEKVEAML